MDTQEAAGGEAMPRFALFTDFDGTLVELAATPDAIIVPDDLGAEIVAAASRFDGALAVISGRELSDLERYLPAGIAVAGGHGVERRRADGSRIALAEGLEDSAAALAQRLRPFAATHEGLLLELKNSAVALHYRLAPDFADKAREAMMQALAEVPGFDALEGKMVIEARPSVAGKAEAVRAFMQEPPFAGRVPVFIGDDTTDEDGFRAAQEMGGVGVKVGDGETAAKVRTPDVSGARAIIAGLAERAAASEVLSR